MPEAPKKRSPTAGTGASASRPSPPAANKRNKTPVGGRAARPVDRHERQGMEEAAHMREEAKRLMKEAKQRARRAASISKHRERMGGLAGKLGLDPNRPVTVIPPLPKGHSEEERIVIQKNFAYVRISLDDASHQRLYEVIEPTLEGDEQEAYDFIRDTLIRTLGGREAEGQDPKELLREAVEEIVADHSVLVDEIARKRIWYHLVRDFLGYGEIDVLMRDPELEDISCDGPGIPIFLYHRRLESMRTNVKFSKASRLDGFVIRLAQQSGKHISIADPILDATLPDGSRLQTTLSNEVTTRGSSFTIRRFRESPMTPADLIGYGTVSSEMAAFFWFTMEHGHSLLMAGGTASGKTTTLNAMCQFIPSEKKIVSIEDTREINLSHENWIAGVTRSGFGSSTASGARAGAIDMFELLAAALRQRPEYLLVGEVRGKEALTLFQAMATGHAVYSTMHADSVQSAVYRLENPPVNVPRMMLQTLDVFAIQAQVRIGDKMGRRIVDLTELVGFDPESGDLLTNTVFKWDVATDDHRFTGKSFIMDQIMQASNLNQAQIDEEWARRTDLLERMTQVGVEDFLEVASILAAYERNPENAFAIVDAKERRQGGGQGGSGGNAATLGAGSTGPGGARPTTSEPRQPIKNEPTPLAPTSGPAVAGDAPPPSAPGQGPPGQRPPGALAAANPNGPRPASPTAPSPSAPSAARGAPPGQPTPRPSAPGRAPGPKAAATGGPNGSRPAAPQRGPRSGPGVSGPGQMVPGPPGRSPAARSQKGRPPAGSAGRIGRSGAPGGPGAPKRPTVTHKSPAGHVAPASAGPSRIPPRGKGPGTKGNPPKGKGAS